MEARILSSSPKTIRRRSLAEMGRGPRCGRKQDGAVAIVLAVALTGLLGFCGLALDMALVYNRNVEMRNVADAAALAAARKLNGTANGINDAVSAATTAATSITYDYGRATINWSASAIKFSTSPDRSGNWVDAGTAAAAPARIFYVKVDTAQLDGAGDVQTLFMPLLSSALATVNTISSAIAGRTTIDVAPLAICAMSTIPGLSRANTAAYVELVEYGFRRGVSYDLMNLTPRPGGPANFVVNPLATPGTAGSSLDMQPSAVGPYVCTGTLGIARITGDEITVAQPFPLGSLFNQLNSRFDQYVGGLCNFHAAPPDANIRSYVSTPALPWLNTASSQTAATAPTPGKLETIADLPYPGGSAAEYGPVWAYAKAVPFSAYTPGVPEPSPSGYSTFGATNAIWSELYGGQQVRTYPSSTNTPYKASSGVNFSAPSAAHMPGVRGRRVLNVPLLSCATLPGSTATVLAIGRFFMTVPATATSIAAEFGGAVPVQNIEGQVGLFP